MSVLKLYLRADGDAWGLLTQALSLHGLPSLPTVARTDRGKPYFPDYPDLHFNLSHTRGFSLCALSDAPVGVDVEAIRPRKERLWQYCLTGEEWAAFQAQKGGWPDFYRLWTLKEAWCKCTGEGLGHPKRWPLPPPTPHRSYSGDGWAAAVCAAEPPGELILL